jgi:hypothetical protein
MSKIDPEIYRTYKREGDTEILVMVNKCPYEGLFITYVIKEGERVGSKRLRIGEGGYERVVEDILEASYFHLEEIFR